MLNIPEEVRNLFKDSDVKKNIRIHFPNGERPDIINDNIEEESLSFTESICSQSELKFGLCEAPVLEFSTAEIENIKGMEIEASIEVDVSTAENVTKTIQFVNGKGTFEMEVVSDLVVDYLQDTTHGAGVDIKDLEEGALPFPFPIAMSYDFENRTTTAHISNVYYGHRVEVTVTLPDTYSEVDVHYKVGYTRDDLPFPYYSIPLGRYVVKECPRNEVMFEKRNVTAYGKEFDINHVSVIEQQKRRTVLDGTYTFNIAHYAASNAGFLDESTISWGEKETTTETISVAGFGSSENVVIVEAEFVVLNVGYLSQYSLYKITNNATEKTEEDIVEFAKEYVKNVVEDFDSWAYQFEQFEHELRGIVYPYIASSPLGAVSLTDGTDIIYPFVRHDNKNDTFGIYVPRKLTFYTYDRIGTLLHSEVFMEMEDCKIYSGDVDTGTGNLFYTINEYDGSEIDFRSIFESYVELHGAFGRFDRYGKFKLYKVNDSFGLYPSEDLLPSETLYPAEGNEYVEGAQYTSLWYEDSATLPYGKVSAIYMDENEKTAIASVDIAKEHSYNNVKEVGQYVVTRSFMTIDVTGITFEGNGIHVSSPWPLKSVLIEETTSSSAQGFDVQIAEGQTDFEWNGEGATTINDITGIILYFDTTEYSGNVILSEYEKNPVHYNDSECQAYIITDNEILKSQSFTEDEVKAYLEVIAENIKDVWYLPAEIEMQGLPYLEAGDVLQVDSENIGFQTIIMRRTMTGIQALMDSIESKG